MADDAYLQTLERLVSQRWGESVHVDDLTPLGGSDRSKVARIRLSGGDAPATVVVKQACVAGNAAEEEAQNRIGLCNDWAGLQLLATAGPDGPWPTFLAGDREAGVLIMEDFGDVVRLDQVLLGESADTARRALTSFAEALGELHGLSAGHGKTYQSMRAALGPEFAIAASRRIQDFAKMVSRFESPSLTLAAEIDRCSQALDDPGPFSTYTHGDPCPDNCLVIDGRVHLVDFEWGGLGHALTDAAFIWVHFPTCWCVNRLPEGLREELLDIYRRRLAQSIPEANDDEAFGLGLVGASVTGFGSLFGMDPFENDRQWGIATIRQRCRLRIDIVKATCERYGFPATADAAALLAHKMDDAWSNVEPMPLYPAFRG